MLCRHLKVNMSQLSSASLHPHLAFLLGFQNANYSKNIDLIVFSYSSPLSHDALLENSLFWHLALTLPSHTLGIIHKELLALLTLMLSVTPGPHAVTSD